MNTHYERRHAIHRIRAKQQLAAHFVVFLAMSAFFVLVWAQTGADYFWPIWAMFGWGIGLVAHAIHILGWSMPISEERIQREVERHR